MSPDQLPLVLQYNKRDLRNILPVEKLNEALNGRRYPYFEAAALHGVGVFETLKAISRLAIADIRKKVAADTTPRRRFGETTPAEGRAPSDREPPPRAEPENPLELLLSSPPELERIQGELQKLRATATAPPPPPRPPARVELSPGEGAREDVKRKAALEVPATLLKDTRGVKVQLVFERSPGGEDVVAEALSVKLGGNRRLERLNLHLDLEVKGKP
jgi:hypothetical protein